MLSCQADTGSVQKKIATIIRRIDSEVQSIHASKANQNGISKHSTNLKLRIDLCASIESIF